MPTVDERAALGRWGEKLAARYLRRRGYALPEANYRSRWGEIDLIAVRGRYLVFVEVKLRKNDDFGAAREFVNAAKQQRIRRTAERWLQLHAEYADLQPRFDVIEIYAPRGQHTLLPQVRHIENAF